MVGPDHARPGLYNDVPHIHIKKTTKQAFSDIVASLGVL